MSSPTTNPTFVKNLDSRQQVLSGYAELNLADFEARSNVIDFELPSNAEIVDGAVTVSDTFDGGTLDGITVGDAAVANRYLTTTSIKAAARTPLVPTGYVTTAANNKLRITRTQTGTAATKGTLRIYFLYVQLGQSDFTQG